MAEPATSAVPPQARVVPGAPPPVPLTKSQLKKRKKAVASKTKTAAEEGLDIVANAKDAALVDHVPTTIAASLVATEDEKKELEATIAAVETDSPSANAAPSTQKPPSPIVDQIINKRIKALGKKIQRINQYSSKAPETLNEDQKRTLLTLPNLEASLKELEDIKKGIETLEQEHADRQAAAHKAEALAVEHRITEAVSFAEAQNVTRTRTLVAFLALSTLLATPIPLSLDQLGDHRIPSDETEKVVVVEAGRTLLTPEFGSVEKDNLLKGLLDLHTEGEFHGITYDRLRKIAHQFIHPPTPIPSAPASPALTSAPIPAEPTDVDVPPTELERELTPTPTIAPVSQPPISSPGGFVPTTGSFQFMSESDLDIDGSGPVLAAPPSPPHSEWVQVESTSIHEDQEAGVERNDAVLSEEVQKLVAEEIQEIQAQELVSLEDAAVQSVPTEVAAATTLNWADAEEDGPPPIDSIHESFGNKSGVATPVAQPADIEAPTVPLTNGHGGEHRQPKYHNRNASSHGGAGEQSDADGFVSAGGSRRSRGSRGGQFRGGRGGSNGGTWESRGGGRGGRGGWSEGGRATGPSGDQGVEGAPSGEGYRGRGRGPRGGSQDYGNGGHRGGGRGGYGGADRDGEGGNFRSIGRAGWGDEGGRGRGRGRGGYHRGRGSESRGGAPPAAPVAV